MLDNTLPIHGQDDGVEQDRVLLIIPEDVEIPTDFPLSCHNWSWNDLVSVLAGEFPIVMKTNAEYISMLEMACQLNDVQIKVLDGCLGQYPSYWLIVTNKFPHIPASEIQLAAEETRGLGGTGVPKSKKIKDEFKKLDPSVRETAQDISEEVWNEGLEEQSVQE